jgi:predicted MFS family arabinose efflux permease
MDVESGPSDPTRAPVGLRALRHRNFRLMWFGQMTRGTSQWMQITTVPLYLLAIGRGAVDIAVVAAVQYAPVLLLAPLGGLAADSVPKRKTLLWVQVALTIVAAGMAVLTAAGSTSMVLIVGLALAFGIANAVEMPFRQTYVAELLPPRDLMNGIGLNQGAFQITRVAVPAIAGLLILAVGVTFNFVIAALASTTTFFLLLATRPEPHAVKGLDLATIGPQLRAGVRHIWEVTNLRVAFVMVSGTSLFALSIQPILPVYVTEVLGGDAGAYGAILGAMGLGALAGTGPTALANSRAALRSMVAAPAALAGIALALGFTTSFPLAIALMAGFGFFFVLTIGSANQVIQSTVRPDLRGRVVGISLGAQLGGVAIGGLVAGLVTEARGASTVMIGSAVLTGLLAIGVTWYRSRLPKETRKPSE